MFLFNIIITYTTASSERCQNFGYTRGDW